MCLRFSSGKYKILWPISILRYSLPVICKTFCGQILVLLLSTFKCIHSNNLYYAAEASCDIGGWYYITLVIGCISIILQLFLSYITISLYYHADFICESSDVLKKNNPIPDLIFFVNKIVIIITFMFDEGKTGEHWPILFAMVILTGFNAYANIFWQNYGNEIIKKLHYFFSLFLFWGFFSLLASNIFNALNFSGAFYFFLCGIVIIFIYCLFYIKTNLEFLNSNFSDINNSYDFLNYIYAFMKLVKEKEISRDSSIVLTSFIEKIEEGCTNKKCVLKKYQQSLLKGFDSNFLLLQYAQKLFKMALNRLPKDINLKIHYILFLTSKINQKKNAQKELSSMKSVHMFLYNKFNIYICKKYTEDIAYLYKGNNQSQSENDTSDMFQEIEYKNNYKEFMNLLSKSSSLYYEFWSSLYTSHLQGTEDFRKLNDIGAELNIIIEQIEKIFGKLREIKNNDLTVIKLYESYLRNISNNEEKYEKYHKISNNLITDNKFDFEDKDYTNFDIKNLNNSDEYQFMIISANDDNKGTIVSMSLNICLFFGYTKDEIIGKNMCLLIPELFHKHQIKLFNETTEKIKTEFFENLSNKITYVPQFMEFSGFGRNKLKYLVPLDLKIFFAQTEESDLVYIVDIMRKNLTLNNDLNETTTTEIEKEKGQLCCVLTDNNLIIQTFTSNCIEILGLDSKMINANYDITNFIVQFNDELQSMISASNKEVSLHDASEVISMENSMKDLIIVGDNVNDKSFELKLKKKKRLLKLKYFHQRKILWKVNISNNYSSSNNKREVGKIYPQFSGKKSGIGDLSKKKFLLEVKEAKIKNNIVGYYFYFKKYNSKRNESGLLINLENMKLENPPSNRGKLNKSSIKFIEDEDEHEPAKSSRIYNDDNNKNILGINNIKREKNVSNVSFDLDNLGYQRRNESAKMVSDFKDDNNELIDEKFVPRCNFNFFMDLGSNTFKPTSTTDPSKQTSEQLRNQALEKINIVYQLKKKMNKKASSNSDVSSKEDSSQSNYTSSYINSSSNEESKIKSKSNDKNAKIEEKNINENNNKENDIIVVEKKNKTENIENEYYKISIAKIKLMVYDFNKEMVVSVKSEKKSQVETIIDNYKARQNINISEDANYVNLSFDKYIKDLKNKEKNSSKNLNKTTSNEHKTEKNNVIDAEKEFEKEITYTLSKQEDQNTIRYFYIISFFFLFLLLVIFFMAGYFVISYYNAFNENLEMIISSINLKYFTNIALYSVRENYLLGINNTISNSYYKIPDDNRTFYVEEINTMSKNAFSLCNSYMEKIIGNSRKLTENTLYKLSEEPFNITIIYGDNQFREVTSTIFSSLIQIYSALCNLIQNLYTSVSISNSYNFMHNSFNKIAMALNLQTGLFIAEIGDKWTSMIIITIIFSVVYIFVYIIMYILICKGFVKISNKKASYISVFYGIDLSLIKSSIRKCEFFINKINQNEKGDNKLKLIEEENSTVISTSNFNLNNSFNNQNKKEKKITRIKKNKSIGSDRRTKHFKIVLLIGIILSIIIFIVILLSVNILVNKFVISTTLLYNLQNYHNNIVELFNAYREYLFDEKTIISEMNVYKYLEKKEEDFYNTNINNINTVYTLQTQIKELNEALNKFKQKGLCSSYITTFSSEEECLSTIGGKDGISKFGFPFFVNDFIEDLRYYRNAMKSFFDYGAFIGNLTIISEDYFIEIHEKIKRREILFNVSYFLYRLEIFNQEPSHTNLNIKFINVILPYVLNQRTVCVDSIQESIKGGYIIYIVLISIFAAIITFIFAAYWIPMIRVLNMEIYKTKNMLTIIPVQILASLPNIRELLNISNKR